MNKGINYLLAYNLVTYLEFREGTKLHGLNFDKYPKEKIIQFFMISFRMFFCQLCLCVIAIKNIEIETFFGIPLIDLSMVSYGIFILQVVLTLFFICTFDKVFKVRV